jgi:hypothetical protein
MPRRGEHQRHDNTLLRQELGQHGEIIALEAHRTTTT